MSSYFGLSKSTRYSLLFSLPLLLLYESLALATNGSGGGIRNGADAFLRRLFTGLVGPRGPLLFSLIVVAVFVVLVARDVRRHSDKLQGRVFAGMIAESVAYALVFGVVIGTITAQLMAAVATLPAAGDASRLTETLALPQGPVQRIGFTTALTVSLGAGLYEELLFRVLLVGGMVVAARRVLGLGPIMANASAVTIGALVFSAFHYVGAYADRFTVWSFAFRAVAGLAFSALYVTRGFGITAWTHALYDVFLLIGRGA